MRPFVTGGSGFLGQAVLSLAAERGLQVLALARSGAAAERVAARGAVPVPGDLDDPRSLDAAFATAVEQGADVLVNLASLGFGHAPAVVSAAEDAGLRRAVFVSTTAVATRLPAATRRIRLEAERVIQDSGLDWTVLRPTMVYGHPGDRNLSRLLALLHRVPLVPVPGGGRGLQQPVHVDDLAAAVLAAAEAAHAVGRRYDVAGPEPVTFRELLEQAGEAVGRRPLLVPTPLGPTAWLLARYEELSSRPRLRAEQVRRLAEDKVFDITPAVRDLGFRPRSFRDGIRAEARELAC